MEQKDPLIRRIVKSRAFNIVIIAVVVCVPLLYAGLLTWTYSNPIQNLSDVEAAVVNLDTGATQDGPTGDEPRKFNMGDEIVQRLTDGKEDAGFTWKETSAKAAQAGLEDGKYLAVLTIPANLSADVSKLDSADATAAAAVKMQLTTNDGVNYLAGTMARPVASELQGRVRESANQQITEALVKSVTKIHDQILPAVDGAKELADGNQELASGAGDLASGNQKLATGADDLASGNQKLAAGAGQLAAGAGQVQAGSQALANGIATLHTGLSTLNAQSQNLPGQATKLKEGADQLAAAATALSQAAAQLHQGVNAVTGGSSATNPATSSATSPAANAETVAKLQAAAAAVDQGATQLSQGLAELQKGTDSLNQAAPALAGAISQAATGSEKLDQGAKALLGGTAQLSTGSVQLQSGSQAAAAGATKLASGAREAASGATKLNDGARQAADGAAELHQKLADGVAEIPAYDAQAARRISDTAATAVSVDAVRANPVNSNGAGFTPFFMALALWIGGIAAYFIFPALDRRRPGDRWYHSALRSFGVAALVGIGQALMVGLIVGPLVGATGGAMAQLLGILMLTSLAFVAINQALLALLGFRGRFFSVLLLVLQISAMGATFPISTAPGFMQAISPWLPMTHISAAIRTIIAGQGLSVWPGVAMALVTLVGSVIVTAASAYATRREEAPNDDPTVQYTDSAVNGGPLGRLMPASILN